jgi:hypothetical protein
MMRQHFHLFPQLLALLWRCPKLCILLFNSHNDDDDVDVDDDDDDGVDVDDVFGDVDVDVDDVDVDVDVDDVIVDNDDVDNLFIHTNAISELRTYTQPSSTHTYIHTYIHTYLLKGCQLSSHALLPLLLILGWFQEEGML